MHLVTIKSQHKKRMGLGEKKALDLFLKQIHGKLALVSKQLLKLVLKQ